MSLLKGLPESFKSFNSSIRMTDGLTPPTIRTRILAEDAAMGHSSYSKVVRGSALQVGEEKTCTTRVRISSRMGTIPTNVG
jgi:hypothetical protein